MIAISTHVLDLASGRPARGVAVALSSRANSGEWTEVGRGVTDTDGRLRDLLAGEPNASRGEYRLHFETGSYFRGFGVRSFYSEVVVSFRVDDDTPHHVPLLLSPFGYSTYRGS